MSYRKRLQIKYIVFIALAWCIFYAFVSTENFLKKM